MADGTFLSGILSLVLPASSAPGVFRTRAETRSVVCTPLDAHQAAARHPDQLAPPHPRGDYFSRDLMVCSERILRPGLREARDEAVLSSLEAHARALAAASEAIRPDLVDRTWLVEAHYPSGAVAYKIRFATQNALMETGLTVSDRIPQLAAPDIDALVRLPPDAAYAGACTRYAQSGTLDDRHALLAVVVRDPRQTDLQAGVCADGDWMWVR